MHQLLKKGRVRRTDAAFFYGFPHKISNVKNAVVLLGYNTVRNAIVSVSVINTLPKTLLFQDFEMIEFWKHSLAVAVTRFPGG
jgi:HD-like signal output (HDOD) protein